jgi:hypothetical protein
VREACSEESGADLNRESLSFLSSRLPYIYEYSLVVEKILETAYIFDRLYQAE